MSLRHNAHAVIIGINKYQDRKIPNLKYARADAESVYQILTDPELGRIPPNNVILLLDEEATQRKIRSAIGTKIPQRVGEKDIVYIYYAGHGAPIIDRRSRSIDGLEKYLIPVDAELDDLFATGIAMNQIQEFFTRIESKQVIFFVDSCYSGEAGGRTFQHPLYQKRAALTNEFLDRLAGEGRMVVTACDVNEISLEVKKLRHGLYTHYLIDGLKGVADKDQDGLVTIHELYDYVYDNVSQHARQLGGSMHPTQKGTVKGKIFLTQYEIPSQKQARELDAEAQSFYQAGKLDKARDRWQKVLLLVPEHEAAKEGLEQIENRQKDEQRQKQERMRRVLLNLFHKGKLPPEELKLAVGLIEKVENGLTGIEIKTRRLLDDLTTGKISVLSYLKSLGLSKKTPAGVQSKAVPKPAPKIKLKKPGVKRTKPRVRKKRATPTPTIVLRKIPTTLSEEQVVTMLAKKNFYDFKGNENGKGITHNYVKQTLNGDKVVLDKATGLMWQQSDDRSHYMVYSDTEKYIRELNNKSFAGFTDWRLPTLEEAMSLMEREKKNGDLYIDPKFDQMQRWIWTADKQSAGVAWFVCFDLGYCSNNNVDYQFICVRAVRSGQSSALESFDHLIGRKDKV